MTNSMVASFKSLPENEGLSRMIAAAFLLPADPTLQQISEIKTAVSEAVTNCIVHAYGNGEGEIRLCCELDGDNFRVEIRDRGKGIEDVARARQPMFTTNADGERTGMGFTVMELFMDSVSVESEPGQGTCVTMTKSLKAVRNE